MLFEPAIQFLAADPDAATDPDRRDLSAPDQLARDLGYLPITTEVMRLAAGFWAEARKQGLPTASDESLDADVILAAQAAILNEHTDDDVVIATTNPRHHSRFVDARVWQEIAS